MDQLHGRTKVCNNCDNTWGGGSNPSTILWPLSMDFLVSLIVSNFRILPCNSS